MSLPMSVPELPPMTRLEELVCEIVPVNGWSFERTANWLREHLRREIRKRYRADSRHHSEQPDLVVGPDELEWLAGLDPQALDVALQAAELLQAGRALSTSF